jgi:tetratricopeptide (TPR) repeat protein
MGALVYHVAQKPWRFDIPRNTALNLIPNEIDICLSIDLDELLQPGWSEALNKSWIDYKGKINRISYDYIWNWKEDNVTPDIRFFASKIHSRHGYIWKHPCHEGLYWQKAEPEQSVVIPDIVLHHRADNTKSRRQYLNLLALAIKEEPLDDRMRFYYGRELYFNGKMEEAAEEFTKHLELESSVWDQERAASMRYLSETQPENKEKWLIKASIECPSSRETLVKLSQHYYSIEDYELCYVYGLKALKITERSSGYLIESYAWDETIYDLIAISAYKIGLIDKARIYGKIAVDINPKNQRLVNNLDFYLQ